MDRALLAMLLAVSCSAALGIRAYGAPAASEDPVTKVQRLEKYIKVADEQGDLDTLQDLFRQKAEAIQKRDKGESLDYAYTLHFRAQVLSQLHRTQEANELEKKAISIRDLNRQKKTAAATPAGKGQGLKGQKVTSSVDSLLRDAADLFQSKDYKAAEDKYQQASKLLEASGTAPYEQAAVLNNIATIKLYQPGRKIEAESYFEKAANAYLDALRHDLSPPKEKVKEMLVCSERAANLSDKLGNHEKAGSIRQKFLEYQNAFFYAAGGNKPGNWAIDQPGNRNNRSMSIGSVGNVGNVGSTAPRQSNVADVGALLDATSKQYQEDSVNRAQQYNQSLNSNNPLLGGLGGQGLGQLLRGMGQQGAGQGTGQSLGQGQGLGQGLGQSFGQGTQGLGQNSGQGFGQQQSSGQSSVPFSERYSQFGDGNSWYK